jgi:hypothetical protein
MNRTLVTVGLALAGIASLTWADEAAVPALKPSISLTQKVEGDTNNFIIASAPLYTANDAVYTQTNLKGQVDYVLGAVKLSPYLQERIEGRYNPGDLEAADASAINYSGGNNKESLGSLRIRNRFYGGLNASMSVVPAFNVSVGLEQRLAADIRTDKTQTAYPSYLEARLNPTIGLNGKIGAFSYDLNQGLPIYFDTTNSNGGSPTFELEGTYKAGAAIALDKLNTLKFQVSEYLDIVNLAQANTVFYTLKPWALGSELRPTVTFVSGDVAPFVGFVWSQTNVGTKANGALVLPTAPSANFVGGSVGLDLKAGNMSFNLSSDLGVDTANSNHFGSITAATITIKN